MKNESSHESSVIAYCSGPLFCPEEVAGMAAIARRLEDAGIGTFLPHRDGIEAYVMRFANTPLNSNVLRLRDLVDRAIFALDVFQLADRCDGVVISLNGRVPDEGAIVEASLAYATGTPLVVYKNDARAPFRGRDNSMVAGLARRRVDRLDDIPGALLKEIARMQDGGRRRTIAPSPEMDDAIRLGRTIWGLLQERGARTRPGAVLEELARLCREDERRYGVGSEARRDTGGKSERSRAGGRRVK